MLVSNSFKVLLVSDLLKVLVGSIHVDIVRKTGVILFSGESGDVTRDCMELHVSRLFTDIDLFVIEVE